MEDARIQKLEALKLDLEEKVRQNPSARAFWVQLGNVCRQLGDKERAISALSKALEIKSDDTFTRNMLAELEGKSLILPTKKTPISLSPMAPAPHAPMPWLPPKKITIPVTIAALAIIGGIVYWVVSGLLTTDPFRLGPLDKNLSYPQVSPDGNWIAYVAIPSDDEIRTAKSTLYMASIDGKKIIPMSTTDGGSYLSGDKVVWLPDSSGFIVQLADPQYKYSYYIFKTDGSAKTMIPLEIPPYDDARPALNPDATKIAYVSRFKKDYTDSIVVAYIDTGKGMEVANYSNISSIVWSPDGSVIAFSARFKIPESHNYGNGLFLIKPDGSDLKMLDLGNNACNPIFWGHNDTKLVYVSNQNLYLVSADTMTDPKPLLTILYKNRVMGDLAVSPDMKVLAFSITEGYTDSYGQRYPVGEIYLLEEGKTEPILAKESHKGKSNPSLTPEGKTMAFGRWGINPKSPMQIWVGSTALK